jgi:hypothetical protein
MGNFQKLKSRPGSPAEPGEPLIQRDSITAVVGVSISSERVCLPDLDQSVADGRTLTVEDPPLDPDPLTGHISMGQHILIRTGYSYGEERADGL